MERGVNPHSTDHVRSNVLPGMRSSSAVMALVALLAVVWKSFPGPEAPIMFVGGLTAIMVAWWRPVMPALACIVFSSFRIQEAYPILHPYQLPLLTAAWAVFGVFCAMVQRRIVVRLNGLVLGVTALGALTAVASLYSHDPDASWLFLSDVYVKILIVTCAVALLIRSDSDFKLFALTMTASGAALGLAAVWNYVLGSQLVEMTRVSVGLDVGSALGDPNDLALFLVIGLSFAVAAFIQTDRWTGRLVVAAAIAMMLCGITLTQSRGGLLATVATTFVVTWGRIPSKKTAVLLTILLAGALFASMDLGSRISGGSAEVGFGESAEHRVELWGIALRQIAANPLVGIGPQTFYRIAEAFTGRAVTVHNTWLQVAVEAGIPTFITFTYVIAAAIMVSWKTQSLALHDRNSPWRASAALGAQGAIAGYCTASTFLSQGFNWSLYLVIAAPLALSLSSPDANLRTSRGGRK
jgi:putative inorganic carbon (hco3(-)) transporter